MRPVKPWRVIPDQLTRVVVADGGQGADSAVDDVAGVTAQRDRRGGGRREQTSQQWQCEPRRHPKATVKAHRRTRSSSSLCRCCAAVLAPVCP